MKVLQINSVYKKGSTGKIVYDIHRCLQKKGIDSVVCYGRGTTIKEHNVYKFCSELESKFYHLLNKIGWLMYAVCPTATNRLIRIIENEKPDIVHIHCINGYCVNIYKLLKYLAKSNIKTVVTHHAEFYYTGNCGYAFECKRFYTLQYGCGDCHNLKDALGQSLFDRTAMSWDLMKDSFDSFYKDNLCFTAVSPWVRERSKMSPICNKFDCFYVPNGVDTNIFTPVTSTLVSRVSDKINSLGRKIILHVTANFSTDKSNIKGGYFVKTLAEMLPQYQFVVVASIISYVDILPPNIYLWGKANGQLELASLYSSADLTIITSKRETFSMIVAESLCCGTPVVGFNAGGPESIGLHEFSAFVDYSDISLLRDKIISFMNQDWNASDISLKALNAYSKEMMTNEYLRVYKELLK